MRKRSQIKVKKRAGESEVFSATKLCDSMIAVGVSESMSQQICNIVSSDIKSGISTDKIFRKTRDYIAENDPGKAAIYSLERGLSVLGPTGFVFEQYVAAILEHLGYKTTTNVYMEGEAVTHEIDVTAEKGNVVYVVEAKYRNEFKSKTHINQVMYADARMEDIKRQAIKNGDTREYYMWLVTNTQFTDNAINYVKFRDMQLMGWNFPKYINLMKVAYEKKLYPVSVLPSITESLLKRMSGKGHILVKTLQRKTAYEIRDFYGVSLRLAKKIETEVQELMH